MDTKKQLTLGMGILFFITILFYGIIIINFKSKEFLMPKIDKKLKDYMKTTYKNEYNNLSIGKTDYDISTNTYFIKVKNKNNKHLYFTVKYKNKKIKDTYNKDYKNGKTLLKHYEKEMSKKLKSKKYQDIEIKFDRTLDNYTKLVQQKLIDNNNISDLSIYSIKLDTTIKKMDEDILRTYIVDFSKFIEEKSLSPSHINFIITDENDYSNAIEITGLTKEMINNSINEIVRGIINNDKNITKKYDFAYKYLNK